MLGGGGHQVGVYLHDGRRRHQPQPGDPLPGHGDGLQRHRRSQRVTGERNLSDPDGVEHRQQPLSHEPPLGGEGYAS